ncbi:MAG: UDP-3-O-(3-hydroxymyristoyl)glucosamine N-acyltransferase [Proteobacteria bacterium]|nr:UDP-3-O-(3-hydroxymyristoyl)glucosamine N-acyltransferase [Pseudomonadota bacterium]
MKKYKLSYIANLLKGSLFGEDIEITGVASIHNARRGDITFLFNKKFTELAVKSDASAFVVSEGIKLENKNTIVVKNPSYAQAVILNLFYHLREYTPQISNKAFVAESAKIDEKVTIMDFAYIDENATIENGSVIYPFVYVGRNVRIGKNVRIYPHAVLMDDTILGDNVIISPGAVIGSDGFGYAFDGTKYIKIPQVGRVVIEDDVEVGANTTIDRATIDQTQIGKGTKIDNLVMIAHNVNIGENCIIVGQVGIAGSAKIGNNAIFGGQVGIADHAEIGNNVMIAAQSGVSGKVEDGAKLAGTYAIDFKKWLKIQAILNDLPELKKKIEQILKGSQNGD